jgi:hypothetical protein
MGIQYRRCLSVFVCLKGDTVMRRIEKIVTNDGVEHANEREARKHCDKMLGNWKAKARLTINCQIHHHT